MRTMYLTAGIFDRKNTEQLDQIAMNLGRINGINDILFILVNDLIIQRTNN